MYLRHLIATACLVAFSTATAQPRILKFEKIEGLSQSTGYSIMKDRRGFLWIATADGLNRYDGIEMRSYKPTLSNKSGQMRGRIIRSDLLEDSDGNIWFSTEAAVQCFNKRTETFASYPLRMNDGNESLLFANPLSQDGDHIWLANAKAGLFRLNIKTKQSVHYPLTIYDDAGNAIQLMYNGVYDHHNKFWFATNNGLLCFNTQTSEWMQYLRGKVFYSIARCRDTLYVSEGKKILMLAPNLSHSYAIFEGTNENEKDLIHRLYTDNQDNVWVGDESGNVHYRPKTSQTFQWAGNINHSGTVRTNYPVYSFYADSSGVLWTGAYMLGLVRADRLGDEFHVFPRSSPNTITENLFVNTFYEDESGNVWLGTFQKGIIVLEKQTGKTTILDLPYHGPPLVYGRSVHAIRSDSSGNLWTGISGHLYVRRKGERSFTGIKIPVVSNSLQNPQVWSIIEYNKGWLVGTNIGLYRLTINDGKYNIQHLSWLGQSRVLSVWQSPANEVWIARESGGIIATHDPLHGERSHLMFPESNIKSFHFDAPRNILWICSSDGLIAYHEPSGKYKVFGEAEGLANSYTYNVLQDANDDLWISTNAGLFRAEVPDTDRSIFPTLRFVSFTRKDGLPDNQFNTGAAYRGPSGTFYFGTPSGIAWFNPLAIQANSYLPKIVMTDITVNGNPADSILSPEFISSLELPYDKDNLSFRFRGIEYNNPTKVQYMYKLEGWDRDWIRSGTLDEARYNKLLPGKYTFKVKAANSSTSWSPDTYTVSITIAPPFWRTWWFYSVALISCVSLVVVITRRAMYIKLQKRLADLERQRDLDRERQRISKEMHDDIGAGLTQITLISEFAKNKAANGANKELNEIASTSRQLVNNMSEIIWSLNPETHTVGQLLAYLREQLNRQLEYSSMRYVIRFPDDDSNVILSNVTRRNILLVTREVVNNAIRHSAATAVQIAAELKDNELRFEISDNGKGFDSTIAYPGNGLKNIQERIRTVGGCLEIASQPGSGTIFTYSISIGFNG